VVDIDELPTKKLALEEDIEEETYVGASVVHETLYRINLDKLSVTIRNQDILDHVQRVCNRSASYIVEKLLDHSYSKLIDCPSLRLSGNTFIVLIISPNEEIRLEKDYFKQRSKS
jgi:hypothetical protein